MKWDRVERRKDNWTLIVKEYYPKIGFRYKDHSGVEYLFFGLVHAEDDYYYGLMSNDGKMRLATCVSGLEMMYEQLPNEGRCDRCNSVLPKNWECFIHSCPHGEDKRSSAAPGKA